MASCPKIQTFKACKDPDAIKAYVLNWTDYLGETEKVITSTWTITCEDEVAPTLQVASQGKFINLDGKSTGLWVESGTNELKYKLTNKIVTDNNGHTDERSGYVNVIEM